MRPAALEEKVRALAGEISQARFGLSEADAALVCREVSVLLNVAASVRFTEPVKNAVLTNVRSAKEAVEMAKAMPNLKVLPVTTLFHAVTLRSGQTNCTYFGSGVGGGILS